MIVVANVPESELCAMQSVPEGRDLMHLHSAPYGARRTARLPMMTADLSLFPINAKTWNVAAIPRSQICPKVVNILLQKKKESHLSTDELQGATSEAAAE